MSVVSRPPAIKAKFTVSIVGTLLSIAAGVSPSIAQSPPEIRLSERNRVPACVTPDRLQKFLLDGNGNLAPKFRDIARYYKEHGERLRVRWDYAFFQMVIETNYLKFVNNAGRGDVSPKQNNFAGIGTTGGGVPGDSFPDVSTGVLGQMQHLVAYSGERVAQPVAQRTRDKQDDIIQKSLSLRRTPTFKDLAGRWAVDRRYGASIEAIASRFRAAYCTGREPEPESVNKPGDVIAKGGTTQERKAIVLRGDRPKPRVPEQVDVVRSETARVATAAPQALRAGASGAPKFAGEDRRSGLGIARAEARPAAPNVETCAVLTASYGGQRNVLIRSVSDGEMQYTALQVLEGQEQRLARSFIKTHAVGGEPIGEFANREAALAKAFELCPTAKSAQ